jgi:BirA family biotin operon repressor/biotin-[acetyl-CoA-carboxylase] ligase
VDGVKANQSAKWRIRAVPETGSTNADLMALADQGEPEWAVLRADFQSAGRGRLDRTWQAPPGENFLVSILFRQIPEHLHVLTQLVAIAAQRAITKETGVDTRLKWPNDLLVGDRKVAGVLAQSGGRADDGRPAYVVVGIGINVGWAPPEATSLRGEGWTQLVTPEALLHVMLAELDVLLELGDDERHSVYVASLGTIGERVRVDLPDGTEIVGRAMSVERDGRLVVLDECAVTHRVDTADVVHLRRA